MKVGGLEKKRVNLMNMEWNEIFNYSSFALKNMCSTFFFFQSLFHYSHNFLNDDNDNDNKM